MFIFVSKFVSELNQHFISLPKFPLKFSRAPSMTHHMQSQHHTSSYNVLHPFSDSVADLEIQSLLDY